MRYVGLDSHWRQSTICVLDHRGQKLLSRTIKGPWSKVLEEIGKVRKPFAVCFEASTGYGYLFEQLQTIALVATAHFLLRAMMAMLRTGEVWRLQEEAAA